MKRYKWTISIILLIVFLLAVTIVGYWPVQILVLTGSYENESYIYRLEQDTMVSFEFMHSMYNVPQRETFVIHDTELILSSVYFGNLFAALYYDSLHQYPMLEREDGYYIENINISYPYICYGLGHGTIYTIHYNSDKIIDINTVFQNSSSFKMNTTRISFIKYLGGGFFNGGIDNIRA